MVSKDSKYGGVVSYLFFHMFVIFLPSISICWIFFCSYWLNLAFCMTSVGLSTYRGAKYYNYLMIGAFEKILKDAEKSAEHDAGETEIEMSPQKNEKIPLALADKSP